MNKTHLCLNKVNKQRIKAMWYNDKMMTVTNKTMETILLFLKVAFSLPINFFPKKYFKKLAYIYYNKCIL